MKKTLTNVFALMAAACGLQALGAYTPTVMWDGDFSITEKSSYKLNLNGNTITNGYIKITGTKGVEITLPSTASSISVLIKYTNLVAQSSCAAIFALDMDQGSPNEIGFKSTAANALTMTGYWGTGVYTPANNPSVVAGSGYAEFAYCAGSKSHFYAGASHKTAANTQGGECGLKFTGYNINKVYVGGPEANTAVSAWSNLIHCHPMMQCA